MPVTGVVYPSPHGSERRTKPLPNLLARDDDARDQRRQDDAEDEDVRRHAHHVSLGGGGDRRRGAARESTRDQRDHRAVQHPSMRVFVLLFCLHTKYILKYM